MRARASTLTLGRKSPVRPRPVCRVPSSPSSSRCSLCSLHATLYYARSTSSLSTPNFACTASPTNFISPSNSPVPATSPSLLLRPLTSFKGCSPSFQISPASARRNARLTIPRRNSRLDRSRARCISSRAGMGASDSKRPASSPSPAHAS
ncbi:hypothetical protein BJY59DRAFT_698579 [Rhodotorula toruloides]